jgi:hypothetical protein
LDFLAVCAFNSPTSGCGGDFGVELGNFFAFWATGLFAAACEFFYIISASSPFTSTHGIIRRGKSE